MNYLALLKNEESDLKSGLNVPFIRFDNRKLCFKYKDEVVEAEVVPCIVRDSVFPNATTKLNDDILNGCAVSGKMLGDFIDTLSGARIRNPEKSVVKYNTILNVGSVGSRINLGDTELAIDIDLATKFEVRGEGFKDANSDLRIHIKYSDNKVSFTKHNGHSLGTYIGYYISEDRLSSYNPSDYVWVDLPEKNLPPIEITDGKYFHIIFSSTKSNNKKYWKNYPNNYYSAFVSDNKEIGDLGWEVQPYLSFMVVEDGCPRSVTSTMPTDSEMDEMMKSLNEIEGDIVGKYDTMHDDIIVRFGDISDQLSNAVLAGNSKVTDVSYITKFHREQYKSSNFLTYLIVGSFSMVHSDKENICYTDLSLADYSTSDSGDVIDSELNGRITARSKGGFVTLSHYDRKRNKPSSVPIIITGVRDEFSYKMYELSAITDIESEEDLEEVILLANFEEDLTTSVKIID